MSVRQEPTDTPQGWIRRLAGIPSVSLPLVALAWIAYILAFALSLRSGDSNVGAMAVAPLVLTVWGRGWRIGLASALLVFPLHSLISTLMDERWMGLGAFVGWLALIGVGVIVGAASDGLVQLVDQIDEAETASSRLATVQEEYRTLYEDVPIGLWRTKPDGTILEVNPAFAGFFGRTPVEMREMNAADLYLDPSSRPSRVRELVDSGLEKGLLLALIHKTGRPVFVRANTQVVRGSDGQISHFDGVGVDVTAEVESERARIASDERFRWAFEAAPIGMVLSTPDLKIVRANRALEEFLGYERQELDGLPVTRISHDEDMDENLSVREIAGGGTYQMRKRYIRKDGQSVTGLLIAADLIGGPEDDPMVVAFVVDLADQLKAQEVLQDLVDSKDDFLATVSHELRTPLTVVHGMAHELRDHWSTFAPAEAKELAGLIADQSSELSFLVEDLLVAARADAGSLEVKAESIAIRDEVSAALSTVPASVSERVLVECGDHTVRGDRLRVRQILRNLLTNADRYGGERIMLRVTDATNVGLCLIQVRDDGPGVPADMATAVFEPYARAHSRGIVTESVGLGLTVSRTLAESMGGSLSYSRRDGWSVFELALRLIDVSEKAADGSEPISA